MEFCGARTHAERRQSPGDVPARGGNRQNALGTAPGFHVQQDGAHIFVLPGPPGELQAMFNELYLRASRVFGGPRARMGTFAPSVWVNRNWSKCWMTRWQRLVTFSVSALNTFGVDIVLTRAGANVAAMDQATRLHQRPPNGLRYYTPGELSLARVVGDGLAARSQTVAVAESAHQRPSRASLRAFRQRASWRPRSRTRMKRRSICSACARTIDGFGAVSEEVYRNGYGIRRRAKASWGLARPGSPVDGPRRTNPSASPSSRSRGKGACR